MNFFIASQILRTTGTAFDDADAMAILSNIDGGSLNMEGKFNVINSYVSFGGQKRYNVLFSGTREECRSWVRDMDSFEYRRLTIGLWMIEIIKEV